jgi:hypothetical protein
MVRTCFWFACFAFVVVSAMAMLFPGASREGNAPEKITITWGDQRLGRGTAYTEKISTATCRALASSVARAPVSEAGRIAIWCEE